MNIIQKIGVTAGLVVLLGAGSALAQGHGPQNDGKEPMKPPQQAFDACSDKSDGDKCTMTMPDGQSLEGICRKVKEGLACAPPHPPKDRPSDGDGPKPPQS